MKRRNSRRQIAGTCAAPFGPSLWRTGPPQRDGTGVIGRSQRMTIGAERHGVDACLAIRKAEQLLTRADIPDSHGAVLAGRCRVRPSGERASPRTAMAWPGSFCSCEPEARSQISILPPSWPVIIRKPSGKKVSDLTAFRSQSIESGR